MDALELEVTRVVAGGDGMARDPDGRVVFVRGALPGERVRAQVTEQRKDFSRAHALDVLEAAPDRVVPPCPHVAHGCGGCDWQHVAPERQRHLKADIVADALRRQAHLDVEVDPGPVLGATRHRSTLRGVAQGGRFGLRARASHDVVPIDACLVAHPSLDDLIGHPWPDGEVVLRSGTRTGERLAVVAGASDDEVTGPHDTLVVTDGALAAGRRAWFHEVLGGHRFRVSARSFLQARPDGADALVDLVRDGAGLAAVPGARMVDLYGGIGLFAATVGREMRATVVESSASAVADARINLAGLDARVVKVDVSRWRPTHADLVVADPPRAGLGRAGVRAVGATGATRLVLVSCDPAALGRDAGAMVAAGWALRSVVAVDLFPQTSHVEAVSVFERGSAA
jgi:23S rRNA (uracil1939-C5)-methyltransferase